MVDKRHHGSGVNGVREQPPVAAGVERPTELRDAKHEPLIPTDRSESGGPSDRASLLSTRTSPLK
jgi:hypothetical protein